MPDFNAQMFSCGGLDFEISGYEVETAGGIKGRRLWCEKCEEHRVVPGSIQDAKQAILIHASEVHGIKGELKDWCP